MSKNKGYIALWRDIQEHSLWNCEAFTKGQAFVDLLLMANYTEKNIVLGNEVVRAEIGSVITSELKLMKKWRWGKEKLRNFLKLLESLEMIKRESDRHKTIIYILNYVEYQTTNQTATNGAYTSNITDGQTANQTTNRPRADHEQTTDRPQTIKINKENKENNTKRETEKRHQHGHYNNVLLSDQELKSLQEEYPKQYLEKLEALSEYLMTHNKSYKSHYATIRAWIRKDLKEGETKDEREDKGEYFSFDDFMS